MNAQCNGGVEEFLQPDNAMEDTTHACRIAAEDGTLIQVRHSVLIAGRPVCLLIHGSGEGAYVWQQTVRSLVNLCPVVVVDLRGHGDSQRSTSGRYDLQTHTDDMARVIRALKLSRIILVGHSLGGQVATHLYTQLRSDVAAIVLVDICPRPDRSSMAQAALDFTQSLRIYGSAEEYAAALIERRPLLSATMARSLAAGALRPCTGGYELKADQALANSERDEVEHYDRDALRMETLLSTISCPSLVIRGAGSAFVSPAAAADMICNLIRGQLVAIANAGHAVMTDNPVDFNRCMHAFVSKICGS